MNFQSQYRYLLTYVDKYSNFLESLTEEEFQRSPAIGIWSYAEVYSHIFQSNLGSLVAAEKCINGTAGITSARINWLAALILLVGRFPPGKIKAPERIAAMVKKISKEEARNLIVKFRSRLVQVAPSVIKALPNQKIMHPRLGLLNAAQWFRFIQIHTKHHLMQLERIHAMLGQMIDVNGASNIVTKQERG